jgi:hypothetical protein
MKTSYFWKATHEPNPNTTYVSISKQRLAGCENIREYVPLMPSWDIINIAHRLGYSQQSFELYRDAYFKQLSCLNPKRVYNDLKDCTIICFESSKDLASGKKFCHRRMVAGWLESELGVIIPEETRDIDQNLVIPTIYFDTKYMV